jgi:hypothetical protein
MPKITQALLQLFKDSEYHDLPRIFRATFGAPQCLMSGVASWEAAHTPQNFQKFLQNTHT